MRGDARRAELRHNQRAMADNLRQPARFDATDDLVGAEGSLAGRAPDVDAVGVDHENPGVKPIEFAAQAIETQLVVRRHEHGRLCVGLPDGVQAGLDAVAHPPDAPAHLPSAEPIGRLQDGADPGNLADGGGDRSDHPRRLGTTAATRFWIGGFHAQPTSKTYFSEK